MIWYLVSSHTALHHNFWEKLDTILIGGGQSRIWSELLINKRVKNNSYLTLLN